MEASGYEFGGYAIQTQENFLTIPGIYASYDTKVRVTLVNNRFQIGDGSPNVLTLIIRNIPNQLPITYSNGIITQNNLTLAQASGFQNSQGDWGFLENGSNWGIFGMMKIKFGTATSQTQPQIFTTQNPNNPALFRFNIDTSNRRLRYQLLNQSNNANLTNFATANNSITDDVAFTFGIVRRAESGTNNFTIYINDVGTNFTNSIVQSPNIVRNVGLVMNLASAQDHRIDWGFLHVYNWSSVPTETVNQYTTRARTLVESIRNTYPL